MTAAIHRWRVQFGDIAFDCAAPAGWARDQQRYLADYVPEQDTHREITRFGLSIHPGKAPYQQILDHITTAPVIGHLEPVPGMVVLEHRTATGDRYYAVNNPSGSPVTNFAVRAREQSIELYLPGDMAAMRRYPLRMMREAMLRTHEDHGGVIFHAAGADLAGQGIMICGPRSAGKTTVLTCLVRATGAALLSNDRLILDHQRRIVAVPLPVALARGTLEAIPELIRAPNSLGRPYAPLNCLPTQFGTPHKREMSPRGYTAALNSTIAAESQLRAIVIPHLAQSADPLRIQRLSPSLACELLRTSCFTPHDEFWQRPWLVPRTIPEAILSERAEQLTREFADNVPCLEIRFGIRNPLSNLDNALRNLEQDLI